MEENYAQPAGGNTLRNIVFAVVGLYVVVSLVFMYQLNTRIASLEAKQSEAEQKLQKKLSATEEQIRSTSAQVDSTQEALARRAGELQKQQRSVESKLSEESKKREAALGEVTSAVAGVKTDVGGVKSDVVATKSDLEATKARLESLKGDLGIQSGLIATTREDLELLKHKGDRNYYEFSLTKSKTPTPVSTVSLQLKKTDQKKGKYTLNVIADDRTIEKKDRNMNEPLQFYTGRDHQLYELVVFEVAKDKVSGYVSTPKNAAVVVNR
jgi:multidrug efflux pump subunit AcrA (membrane-fusion protein)